MIWSFSIALAVAALVACDSTQVYNWKPQARGGTSSGSSTSTAVKPDAEITPESVLDESAAPEHQAMWVAVPAGRDGSIVWVQTSRGVTQRR